MEKAIFTNIVLLLFAWLLSAPCPLQASALPPAGLAQKREALADLIEKQVPYSNTIPSDSVIAWCNAVLPTLNPSDNQTQHENELFFRLSQLLSDAYAHQGDFGLAIKQAQATYTKAHSTNYRFGSVIANMAIGNAYNTIANITSKALESYLDALKELEQIDADHPYKAQVLLKISNVLQRRGQLDAAAKVLDELAVLVEEKPQDLATRFFYYLERTNHNISRIQLGSQYADSAHYYLTLVDSVYHQVPEKFYHFYSRNARAGYLRATGLYGTPKNWKQSEAIYNELIAEESGNKFSNFYRWTALEKIYLYKIQGRAEEACSIYRELYPATDTLMAENYLRQINDLKTQYQLQRLNREAETAHAHAIAMLLTGGIAVLALIGVTTLLLYRRQRQLKQNAVRLAAAHTQAENATRNKSLFLSNMSHEIRTPLNAINGFSTLLADPNLDEETRLLCNDVIKQNSDLLLSLINDVIDFSTIEQGKMKFNISRCDVIDTCSKVVDTVNKVKQTAAEVSFSTTLSELTIETDASRLQQVLINLLINATKFTKQGSIVLSLDMDADTGMARFCVTDTGCGIPPEKQAAIFRRFEKVNESDQGTGLGLSICQLIIENIGGKIWIDPDYTEGSRFCFTHPTTQPTVTTNRQEQPAKALPPGGGG